MFKKCQKYEVYKISVNNWIYKYYVCAETEQEALNRVLNWLANRYPAICLPMRDFKDFVPEDLHVICHFYIGAIDKDEQLKYFGEDLKKIYEIGGFDEVTTEDVEK